MNNVMPYPWELPFTIIMSLFMLVMCVLGVYQWRKWRREQRYASALTARRELQMADTWPSLPTVRPAYHFDHSDMSEAALTYCPQCALEGVQVANMRDDDGFYPLPRGVASWCVEHAVTWSLRAAQENA